MATRCRKSGTGSIHVPAKRRLSARRRDELGRELREFFLHEPGAVSSNYGGIAALALSGVRTSGGNAFGDDVAIARMHRIHRAVGWHEAIRAAYRSLQDREQRVLWLAFGPHKLPPEWRKSLGYTASAALITEAAKDGCKAASGADGEPTPQQLVAWLTRACIKNGKAIVEIATERDRLIDEALVAYDEARRSEEENNEMAERVWGWKGIAEKLGVDERTARRYAKREDDPLKVYRDKRSGKVCIDLEELEAWRERGIEPSGQEGDGEAAAS